MKTFESWDWGDTFFTALLFFASILISIGMFAIFQDHSVRYYFLSQYQKSFCIDGHREWASEDRAVFCSEDIQKTLGVMKTLNDQLAARGAK